MDKQPLKFHGKVTGGHFVPDQPDAFLNHVRGFESQEVIVTLRKFRKYDQRSNNENRYYWGVVVKILSDDLGYTPDEMHEAIKYQFLAEPKEIIRGQGMDKVKKLIMIPGSTASLSVNDFESLMSKIRTWASIEFGIWVPEPNEVPFEY